MTSDERIKGLERTLAKVRAHKEEILTELCDCEAHQVCSIMAELRDVDETISDMMLLIADLAIIRHTATALKAVQS